MKKQTITKHFLIPNRIAKTIIPVERPEFPEWLKFIREEREKIQQDKTKAIFGKTD